MASETIFAYVGPKGSGKTHEGTRVVLDQLRQGRYVVAVIPSLDVSRVAEYLDDDTVYDRLRVVDYDEVDREDFFPSEDRIKLIKQQDGSMAPGPSFEPTAWRESIVPCGAVVVIDEAWRWLETTNSIPPRFKKALHMARHWRGPADWRRSADRAKYLHSECDVCSHGQRCSEIWHPGLGGDVEKGGDGSTLVSMNILLLTQDYSSLNRTLRKQIDQVCDIKSYKNGAVPAVVQKLLPFWKTDGRYSVSTFEGHRLPERRSKAYDKDRKSFEILPHDPAIHGLFEYAGGQAGERAIDDRSSAEKDTRLSYIKYVAFLLVFGALGIGYYTYTSFTKMVPPRDIETSERSTPIAAATIQAEAQIHQTGHSLPRSGIARVAGAVGGVVMLVGHDGELKPASSAISFSTHGPESSIDGYQVSLWSAPVVYSGVRRTELGVTGPGSGLAASALKFADPDAIAAGPVE